jgi:plastocyanin
MTSVDKAAVIWTIAIVVIGVSIALLGDQLQATKSMDQEISLEQRIGEPLKKMEESMEKQKEMIEPKVTSEPEVMGEPEVMTGPVTVEVSLPSGTSVPGCEETNECYIPATVSINAGDTVSWSNDDSAAHTVTSGSAADGPSGKFDSSLLIAGGTFEHTFDSSGTEDYYCMVHPWMTGSVKVS